MKETLTVQTPKVYRLGQQSTHRVRSLKVHFKSTEMKDEILTKARRLVNSENYRSVVIQKDMTPLERMHLKKLVHEKKKRNYNARLNNEEPNWTIRGGIVCKKSNC